MEEVAFAALNPSTNKYKKISILKGDLEKFPSSLLSMILSTNGAFRKKYDETLEAFIIEFPSDISSDLFEHVAYFYKKKGWKNPHCRENGIELNQFYAIIDYFNLPDDFEPDEDNPDEYQEEDVNDSYDTSESDEWDPNMRDDRFDADDYNIDYGYDPNPYGLT